MQGFSYLKDVVTLRYDSSRCTGCGLCGIVCPHGVFTVTDGRASILERDACIECGACMINCAAGAITVDAGVGCAAGLITQWWREISSNFLRRPVV